MALITSPILAIYNVAPISLFVKSGAIDVRPRILPQSDNPLAMLFPVGFIALNAMVIWCFNIWLLKRLRKTTVTSAMRYAISYAFIIALIAFMQFITSHVRPSFDELGGLQFYPYIGSAANNTFILIMIDLIMNRERRAALEIEKANLESLNLKSRHDQLKQQIQPHFLFNALSALKILIRRDQKTAETYTVTLSNFMRASISDGVEERISVAKEMDVFRDYMELQKVRFPDSIYYHHKISDHLLNRFTLPAFTLQTLAENAIKHNEFSKENPLTIEIVEEDGAFTFSNNHTPKRQGISSVGIGLKNLSERFKILSGTGIEVEHGKEAFNVKFNAIRR